jgi:hypothetical protein
LFHAKIRTERLHNTILELHRYINLIGVFNIEAGNSYFGFHQSRFTKHSVSYMALVSPTAFFKNVTVAVAGHSDRAV